MARRTMSEIEKDYKRIKLAVKTAPVISIKAIAKLVGLFESEVRTSLAKHPTVKKKIMAMLEKNKEELKEKKRVEGREKTELKSEKITEGAHEDAESKEDESFDGGFVIDASITGIEGIKESLIEICKTGAKIILTSVTINELDKMKNYGDDKARDARAILAMAVENQNNFYTVLIDETIGIPDDCIIKYCADYKDKVTLLTSDNGMVLKARMYGVQVRYFKQNYSTNPNTTQSDTYLSKRKNTLFVAKKVGHKLIITDFDNDCRSIMVISEGVEYTSGEYELKIGDDVYLATKKTEYMTFAHYQITSLNDENNCRLIYYWRIYNKAGISKLPKANYKSFMRNFMSKYNL